MEGTIANFTLSRHVQKTNQMVILIKDVKSREDAAKLVGKKVTWTSSAKKEIVGKVASAHGNSGAIRVLFEKGMPGQSLTDKVQIE